MITRNRKMIKLISLFFLAGAILAGIIVFLLQGNAEVPLKISYHDLSDHPIYSGYEFGSAENIIHVGIQPLWIPTNLISEVMKRDLILRQALSELGLDIRYYSFLKGDDVNFFLRNKTLHAGIGGDMPAITAAATGEILIPVLIQQGFTSIVANHPMLISDLRGKRIGYAFGSNAHYALLKTLSFARLRETDVRLVPLEVSQMPDALNQGKIEAFSAWEPTPALTLIRYPGTMAIHRSLSSGYLYFLRSFSDQYPQAVRQIMAAEIRAIRWMRTDKHNLLLAGAWTVQAGKILTGKRTELSLEQIAILGKKDILGHSPIIPETDLRPGGPLHREFKFLKNLKKIPLSCTWKKVHDSFDRKIVSEILIMPGKYRLGKFNYDIQGGKNGK